ncbi:MAG: hypothetical protein WDW38_011212 [Sanguina aurantia]
MLSAALQGCQSSQLVNLLQFVWQPGQGRVDVVESVVGQDRLLQSFLEESARVLEVLAPLQGDCSRHSHLPSTEGIHATALRSQQRLQAILQAAAAHAVRCDGGTLAELPHSSTHPLSGVAGQGTVGLDRAASAEGMLPPGLAAGGPFASGDDPSVDAEVLGVEGCCEEGRSYQRDISNARFRQARLLQAQQHTMTGAGKRLLCILLEVSRAAGEARVNHSQVESRLQQELRQWRGEDEELQKRSPDELKHIITQMESALQRARCVRQRALLAESVEVAARLSTERWEAEARLRDAQEDIKRMMKERTDTEKKFHSMEDDLVSRLQKACGQRDEARAQGAANAMQDK